MRVSPRAVFVSLRTTTTSRRTHQASCLCFEVSLLSFPSSRLRTLFSLLFSVRRASCALSHWTTRGGGPCARVAHAATSALLLAPDQSQVPPVRFKTMLTRLACPWVARTCLHRQRGGGLQRTSLFFFPFSRVPPLSLPVLSLFFLSLVSAARAHAHSSRLNEAQSPSHHLSVVRCAGPDADRHRSQTIGYQSETRIKMQAASSSKPGKNRKFETATAPAAKRRDAPAAQSLLDR